VVTHQASRSPADLKGSGWYETLEPPAPPKRLTGKQRADWVIIGAGFAGLAAARRLRQLLPNERIVVLDAQRVGWGAAGRNSGFMIDLPHELTSENYGSARDHDLKQIRMNRAAIAFAGAMAEDFGLNAVFDRCGKFHGAASAKGLKTLRDFEAHLAGLGEDHSSLDAREMKEVTGTDFYVGGTFTPGTVMIQPAAYVRGVASGLADQVEIFESSPVLSIERGRDHVVKLADGEVTTPRIILAVNGQVESFGFFPRKLMHVFTYASMTRALSSAEQDTLGGRLRWSLIPADPMGSTIRRSSPERIIVRNTFTWNPGMATSQQQVASVGKAHDRSFKNRFPMLGGVEMEYRWGGHLALSLNSAAAFGEIEDRVYSACGCNGLGTVKSTLHGMTIAELATGTKSALLDDVVSEPEPQTLYPEPLMSVGARSRLWMTQKKAGVEL